MGSKKRKTIDRSDAIELGFGTAFKRGNWLTKLSAIVFGLGNIVHKQVIRGLLYLGLEIAYLYYMVIYGFTSLKDLITLGTVAQIEVFNEEKQIYEYIVGDNSMLCLLYGILTVVLTLAFLYCMTGSVKSAYDTQRRKEQDRNIPNFLDDLNSLKQRNLHKAMLFAPVFCVKTPFWSLR